MGNNGQLRNPEEDCENGKRILRELQVCRRRSGGSKHVLGLPLKLV